MNDVSLKNNWKNNTLHTFFGLAVSWLFVFSVSRSLKIYFDIEVGALTFLFIVVVLTLFLYFLLYCKRPTVINNWWIAGGIIAAISSLYGFRTLVFFIIGTYEDLLQIFIGENVDVIFKRIIFAYKLFWLLIPMLIYILSFTTKRAFLTAFYIVVFTAFWSLYNLSIFIWRYFV